MMEERYKTLASQGVRNIAQFNRNLRAMIDEGGADALPRNAAGETIRPFRSSS